MPTEVAVALIAFAFLVAGALVYVVAKLWREPPSQNLSAQSQRLARFSGFPKFFDNLLAKSLTSREKLGWLLFFVIALLAVIFTGKPK
ncbi:MAG: hypothetical protein ABL891_17590 [Burkholderiales bacterium]